MTQANDSPTEFASISPSEFFYRNRQMAGFGNPVQAVFSTVRELVENSLDACEDASTSPDVNVSMFEEGSGIIRVAVADNGTGIPTSHVAGAFGRVLYGSKYSLRQNRGTFGLGVTMAALYGQITTGSPVEVHTSTDEESGCLYRILVDIEHNLPIIDFQRQMERDEQGTTVTLRIKGDLNRSRDRILEYLQLTTISTPNAHISFTVNEQERHSIGPWTDNVPTKSVPARPHPRSADPELLRRLISTTDHDVSLSDFLIESFQQIGRRTCIRFTDFMSFNPATHIGSMSRDDVLRLSTALRTYDGFSRPDSRSLSPIGKSAFTSGIRGFYECDPISYSTTGTCEWNGNPFIIEAIAASSKRFPVSDKPTLQRFANRVPLLYDASEDVLTKALGRPSWSRYGFTAKSSVKVFAHICSTRIPYRAAGKQSIAVIPEIEQAALALFRDMGRRLRSGLISSGRSSNDARRSRELAKSLRLIAVFGAELAETPVPDTSVLTRSISEANDSE